MEKKEVNEEVLQKIKSFERINFEAFKNLVIGNSVIPFCKLKTPRTIFYDSETENFLYLNPYWGNFQKCGEWNPDFNIDESIDLQ